MTAERAKRARRRALVWTAAYAAAVVGGTSLLPLWMVRHPNPPLWWYVESICFWEAVGRAIRDSDGQYLGGDGNRGPTIVLLALAVVTWPVVFGLSTYCRRPPPDQAADYGDGPPGPS